MLSTEAKISIQKIYLKYVQISIFLKAYYILNINIQILHILSLFIFVLLNMVYLPFIMRLYLNSVFEVNDLLINCFDVMNIHNTLFFLVGWGSLHYLFYFAPFFLHIYFYDVSSLAIFKYVYFHSFMVSFISMTYFL